MTIAIKEEKEGKKAVSKDNKKIKKSYSLKNIIPAISKNKDLPTSNDTNKKTTEKPNSNIENDSSLSKKADVVESKDAKLTKEKVIEKDK